MKVLIDMNLSMKWVSVFEQYKLGSWLVKILQQHEETLENGALLTVDENRTRIRVLPFQSESL
ncbi:hypothetical protein C6501_14645 [Candidatus Poribacteria bacterium]|nr:MAG: hypothetical protein C6501_14645 [Candidatus Poribacteria bacterium]